MKKNVLITTKWKKNRSMKSRTKREIRVRDGDMNVPTS